MLFDAVIREKSRGGEKGGGSRFERTCKNGGNHLRPRDVLVSAIDEGLCYGHVHGEVSPARTAREDPIGSLLL